MENKKRRVSYLYRTATTAYPCYLPVLGDFSRSWSYKTYPMQKYGLFFKWQAFFFKKKQIKPYVTDNKTDKISSRNLSRRSSAYKGRILAARWH